MNTENSSTVEIPIEAEPDAQRVLMDDADKLARELHKALPGVTLNQVGRAGGAKDAATVITATTALVIASTPIITQIISAFFAARGYLVSVTIDAKAGKTSFKVTKDREPRSKQNQ